MSNLKWMPRGHRPTEPGVYLIYGGGIMSAVRICDNGDIETLGSDVVLNVSVASFSTVRVLGPIPEPEREQ